MHCIALMPAGSSSGYIKLGLQCFSLVGLLQHLSTHKAPCVSLEPLPSAFFVTNMTTRWQHHREVILLELAKTDWAFTHSHTK